MRRVQDGATLYQQSCAFCHGANADGRGPDALKLAIPPENLAALRTTREHFREILLAGVPGTAMPRFGYFTSTQLDSIIDELDRLHGILGPTPMLPQAPDGAGPASAETPAGATAEAAAEARRIFDTACIVCHQQDGAPTPFAQAFEPPPPDLRVYSMTPEHAFNVITHGYPGTEMPSFAVLSDDVRRALAEIVVSLREVGPK